MIIEAIIFGVAVTYIYTCHLKLKQDYEDLKDAFN